MKRSKSSHAVFNTGKMLFVLGGLIFSAMHVQYALAADQNPFATRAQTNFVAAQKKFSANATNAQVAWEFGRACFDLADSATDDTRKAEIAEKGIAACRQAIALDPKCAQAHMYLGMTIGQVADTKRNLAALKMVKEMEKEFLIARDLDQYFDSAGPDRNLGLLYFESPPIVSLGNRAKAKRHLERAAQLAPDYPDNRLNLIEAYLKWDQLELAQKQLNALEKSWSAAKEKFPNENWIAVEQRFEALKQKVASASK